MNQTTKAVNLFHQATTAHQHQSYAQAKRLYLQLLQQHPKHHKAHNNLGLIYKSSNQPDLAQKHFHTAIKIHPQFTQAYNNLANLYLQTRQTQLAIQNYQKALQTDRSQIATYQNLSSAFHQLGDFTQAIQLLKTGLEIQPQHPALLNHLGATLHDSGQLQSALEVLSQAQSIYPEDPSINYNLGRTYQSLNQPESAIFHYQTALQLDPNLHHTYTNLLALKYHFSDFDQLDNLNQKIDHLSLDALTSHQLPAESPLLSLFRKNDPKWSFLIAQSWSRHHSTTTKPKPHSNPTKLNIGYLSTDFNHHPIGQIIHQLFSTHNKRRFNTHCFSLNHHPNNPISQTIASTCPNFHNLNALSYPQIIQSITKHQIHILIDLIGHSQIGYQSILSQRPAPLQIGYLGFPGTSGSTYIDYLITDPILTPPDYQSYYSEKFIFLPGCYQLNSPNRITHQPFTKKDFGLPKNHFIFVCHNKTNKITPSIVKLWSQILQTTPHSSLWLFQNDPIAKNNLKKHFAKHIDPNRLIFSPHLPLDQHLRRLQLADLALDTFPYSGGASTSHCLQSGVPVITRVGNTYLSRMSTSLLTHARSPLITHDQNQYLHTATKLALNPKLYRRIKASSHYLIQQSNLFNPQFFAQQLEQAYTSAWQRHQKNLPPQNIIIPTDSITHD